MLENDELIIDMMDLILKSRKCKEKLIWYWVALQKEDDVKYRDIRKAVLDKLSDSKKINGS